MRRLASVVVALAVSATAQAAAAGQAPAPPDGRWTAPRTPDGQPDIQGIWSNDTLTPLERPARVADKAFYTEEEAAEIERQAVERRERANAPTPPRTGPPPVGGVITYDRFWSGPRDTIVYTRRTSMVVEPADGRVPLRPEAEARRDYLVTHRAESHENMSVYSRCITRGVPGSMIPNTYNTGHHILQIPGYVVILYEMMRDARIIPLDGRPHVDPNIGLWMGDSRGRWEGETLVVETTNFTEKGWIMPNQNAGRIHGVPVSRALRVVERFTRVSEHILDWSAMIEDPNVYTRPWTLELPLERDPTYDLFEYACHEGNRAVSGILGGARVEERRGRVP